MNITKQKEELVRSVLNELAKEENHLPLLILGEGHYLTPGEVPELTFRYSEGMVEVFMWTSGSTGDVWVEVGDTAIYSLLNYEARDMTYLIEWGKSTLEILEKIKEDKLWAYEDQVTNLLTLRRRLKPTTIEL